MKRVKEGPMRRNSGFSLIEVMVVMAILAGLIGGATLMLNEAQKKQKLSAAKTRMASLMAAIEQMKGPEKLGMYPPTMAENLLVKSVPLGKTLGTANDKNQGVESLWVAMRLQGLGVIPDGFDEAESVGNTDGDSAATAVPNMPSTALHEFMDPWGNPFVYIHNKDYKNMAKVERYVLGNGEEVKVKPQEGATGGFARETSYQLWSMGADGKPNTEDDVLGW